MNLTSILVLSVTVLISAASAQVSFFVESNEYFTDVTSKINRAAAVKLCEDQNAELAKITNSTLYYQILFHIFDEGPKIYWIDGIYKAENPNEFLLNDKCTSGSLDLSGLPYLPAATNLCLAIERGQNAKASQIRSLDCSQEQFVLCSKRKYVGCNPVTEPKTPEEEESTTGANEETTDNTVRTQRNRFQYIRI